MVVAPSLLACDFLNVEKEIKRLEVAKADWLHLDVMDGNFVPNITFGYDLVKSINGITNLYLDVHLMIDNPIDYIQDFVDAGSDIIVFHYESKSNPKEVIKAIKDSDVKVGISIKPNTSVDSIIPFLKDIDLVLIMSVEPGFGGQVFMPSSVDKINSLVNYRSEHGLDFLIEVDGGVNADTLHFVKDVDVVVAGAMYLTTRWKIEFKH